MSGQDFGLSNFFVPASLALRETLETGFLRRHLSRSHAGETHAVPTDQARDLMWGKFAVGRDKIL